MKGSLGRGIAGGLETEKKETNAKDERVCVYQRERKFSMRIL